MGDWWSALTGDIQVFYVIGIVAAVFLLLQILLLSFGVGFDTDIDFEGGDGDLGGFISMRGLTAFFFGFGWTGVVIKQADRSTTLAVIGGLVVGFALLTMVGLLWRVVMRMQSSGSLNYSNAVGSTGSVYITVPSSHTAPGQVEVMVQGRMAMMEAYTNSEDPLPAKTRIRVVDTIDPSTVLVERL